MNIDDTNPITAYAAAVQKLAAACQASSVALSERGEFTQELLALLLARDQVAALLSERKAPLTEITQLVAADQQLKKHARVVVNNVTADTWQNWRAAGLPPDDKTRSIAWWWRLDEQVKESWWLSFAKQAGRALLWLVIAVSLSYLVEIARRFVGSGTDALSVVTQGFLALLVGGTLIQFARQLVEGAAERSFLPGLRTLSVSAVALLLLLGAVMLAQPYIAAHYSNLGVAQRRANDNMSAIRSLRRAIDLNPADALAHYNLGIAYLRTLDYENAETEQRAALKWDHAQYLAYSELARLVITRRNDYGEALRLSEAGLAAFKQRRPENGLGEQEAALVNYSLLVTRGMACGGLKLYRQAESSLRTAAHLPYVTGAEALCLQGKYYEAEAEALQGEKRNNEAADKRQQAFCAFLACRTKLEAASTLEAELYGLMQERLAAEDFPNCETSKSNPEKKK